MEQGWINEVVSTTASRGHMYDFLSVLYREEPTLELVQLFENREILEGFKSIGFDIQSTLGEKTGKNPFKIEDLVLEYTRLFIGPGPHISPHESVHRRDEPRPCQLWGDSTVDVKYFVEWLGLSYDSGYSGIPDHISVEFELMQRIIERERSAWLEGDVTSSMKCLEYESWFVKDHLLRWVPLFCDKVVREAKENFYREMARFTKMFLSSDDHYIDEKIDSLSDNA